MTTHPLGHDASPPDLFAALRLRTAAGHRELEDELGLLRPPITQSRFVRTLGRFLGFHRAWEEALARHGCFDGIFAGRARVARLETDLAALGQSESQIAGVPRWAGAARVTRTAQAAMGSLYVMEGSTLGGQHISRALARQEWVPAQGLGYFKPYAAQTGERWEALRQWANAQWHQADWPLIESGANETFDGLRAWFRDA